MKKPGTVEAVKNEKRSVKGLKVLSSGEKEVLIVLYMHAGKNMEAWPSVKTIARLTGRCERTVKRALKRLEKHGFITFVGKHGYEKTHGKRKSKVFTNKWRIKSEYMKAHFKVHTL